jgi:hypothetical protein
VTAQAKRCSGNKNSKRNCIDRRIN